MQVQDLRNTLVEYQWVGQTHAES